MKFFTNLALALTLFSGTAYAVPSLQLDIQGGFYDSVPEDIVTNDPSFDVYAIAKGSTANFDVDYTLVVTVEGDAPTGSIMINNTQVDASDFTPGQPSGLAPHGIFPAPYYEVDFKFSTANRIAKYDTAEITGNPAGMIDSNGENVYQMFSIDTSGLTSNSSLHFDLYGNGRFAPYSHDASFVPPTVPPTDAPFGASAFMLSFMVMTSAVVRRKMTA